MRVGTKLSLAFLILIVLFGGLLLFYHRVLERSVSTGRELASVDSRVLVGASSVIDQLDQVVEDASKYRITGDPRYLSAYRTSYAALSDSLAALDGVGLVDGQRAALDDALGAWGRLHEAEASEDGARSPSFLRGADDDRWNAYVAGLNGVRREITRLRVVSRNEMTGKLRSMSSEAERAARAGWLSVAAALALAGAIAVLIVRSITDPLYRIEEAAGGIARGDFDIRVPVAGGREMASLAGSFNEMAERVGALDQAKRDLLAHVSHDLKTPLASIVETQKLLLDRIPGELTDKQSRLLELSLLNAEHLGRMISKLLELSRLEAGVEEYEAREVDLVAVVRETVQRSAPAWGRDAPPRVRLSASVDAAPVLGDPEALSRVIENLLDNALEHGGGEVDVAIGVDVVEGEGPCVAVRVRDRGPGVPPEERERIFESFVGRNGATGARHVGLGLAICQAVVSAHGGGIEVADPPGGGSEFVVRLPRAAGNAGRAT